MSFKANVISIIIGAMFGLAIAQACATIPTLDTDTESPVVRQCAIVCTAIAGAKCWQERTIQDWLGPAVEAASCFDLCVESGHVAVGVDLECIAGADICTALDRCIKTSYDKASIAPAGALHSSPWRPGRNLIINAKFDYPVETFRPI